MNFSIITPTYKRADKLKRAVKSLLDQTYTDWEMIIVNDSPDDKSYKKISEEINDSRIHYYVNDINRGVNYSRNYALDHISTNSKWVIFLDDDDYLSADALESLRNLIFKKPNESWFVTNRAYANGRRVTKFPKTDTTYSYSFDYLITKRCKGDATHCIETNLINNKKIRFSKNIKQAEEWLFFYQIGLRSKMFYHNHNSTITEGYDETKGLNFRKRSRKEQLDTLIEIAQDGLNLNLIPHPTFLLYLFMRLVRIIVK